MMLGKTKIISLKILFVIPKSMVQSEFWVCTNITFQEDLTVGTLTFPTIDPSITYFVSHITDLSSFYLQRSDLDAGKLGNSALIPLQIIVLIII